MKKTEAALELEREIIQKEAEITKRQLRDQLDDIERDARIRLAKKKLELLDKEDASQDLSSDDDRPLSFHSKASAVRAPQNSFTELADKSLPVDIQSVKKKTRNYRNTKNKTRSADFSFTFRCQPQPAAVLISSIPATHNYKTVH